ncbi:hypothetical protein [Parabacteroides sp. PF5-9]|uniref:hypothetical protein n=1 Tax=Parabacteroides sp. PF5-9 TaxID=1742404 RepID=UPI002476F211|nr:hypothetical protein [Parabacteroides sp. PF5-9]MDH6357238.1 hypothetical protein [Parabacteroides sp. PF5-9]
MAEQKNDLVKIVVLNPFRDKLDKKTRYEVGQELEFEAERADDLVTRELAEYTEPLG